MKLRDLVLLYSAALFVPVAGCAPITPAGVYNTPIDLTISSNKPPGDFARCALDHFRGNNSLSNDGDHYWIVRMGGQETMLARWDFLPAGTGSIAQLRAVQVMGPSDTGAVRKCA